MEKKKFPSLIESIKATKSYSYRIYIYENDAIGTKIAELLIIKSKRRFEGRFIYIYDDFGINLFERSLLRVYVECGVQAVPFTRLILYFTSRLKLQEPQKNIGSRWYNCLCWRINVSDKYFATMVKISYTERHAF